MQRPPPKRRKIKSWCSYRVARRDHQCTHCDTPITAYSEYMREMFVSGSQLEPEKVHLTPPCADAYYTGN